MASIISTRPAVEVQSEHLAAICSTTATRTGAFQLLADLASQDTENMHQVAEFLMQLHYRNPPADINEWEQMQSIGPRPTVRPRGAPHTDCAPRVIRHVVYRCSLRRPPRCIPRIVCWMSSLNPCFLS